MGEDSNALLLAENTLKHRYIGKHDILNRKIEPACDPFYAPEVISGHEMSLNSFFAIT